MAAGKIGSVLFSIRSTRYCFCSTYIKEAGRVGLIYAKRREDGLNECGILPCIKVDYEAGTQLLTYIRRPS